MLDAGNHSDVNMFRNELAKMLDVEAKEGDTAAGNHQYEKTHFMWQLVGTRGLYSSGWWVPTQALTQLGRELNALSKALMGLLLPNFDAHELLTGGGLFFEPSLAGWLEDIHEKPEDVLSMAAYIATISNGRYWRGLSRRDIETMEGLGFEVPDTTCPRTERAILTAARAVIVKRIKNARKEANNG
jgi:hypothetical protein